MTISFKFENLIQNSLMNFFLQVSELSETHSKELEDIEAANNKKLMSEYEKYQELQTKSQRLQEDYERQLQQMEETREHALEELTEYYEKKLQGFSSFYLFIIRKSVDISTVDIQ